MMPMLNLSTGFNLNVLTQVDGRKVAEIRRASNEHDGTISILRFRKKSEVPNIIVECDFDSYDEGKFFLQFENLKSEEIMELYTMVCSLLDDFEAANAATSQDVTEWMISLKDMALDGKPKLNAPTSDIPEMDEGASSIFGTDDPEEIARMMEEAMGEFGLNDDEDEEGEEDNSDMTADQKFTADFFDFCEKDKLHFFRLLQMTDYLDVIKDATPAQLSRFNYLAFISLCFKYDEIRGSSRDIAPSTRLWPMFYEATKKVIGDAIGEYSVVTTIQSLMETLDGYKARNWTIDDVDHIDEMVESVQHAADAEGIELVFNDEIPNKEDFTFYVANNGLSHLISELYGMYSGILYVADIIRFKNAGEERQTAKGFIEYLTDFPYMTKSKLQKNENRN